MFLTGNIVYAPGLDISRFVSIPSIAISENWISKVWLLRAPGNWEPIAIVFPVNHLMVLVPIPNLLIAGALSFLFSANITVAVYRLALSRSCGIRSASGILGALPSFLTGFGCCVPTAAIALGASLAAGLIAASNFLLPASILALGLALIWNASRSFPMTNLSTSVSGEGYDPVCGMLVDEARAKYSAKHNGRKFYFCSGRCKATFDGQPSAYVQGVSGVHWIQSYSVLPKSRDPEIRV